MLQCAFAGSGCALRVAFEAVGEAAGASFLVAGQFADAFLDAALHLIADALDVARSVSGVMLGVPSTSSSLSPVSLPTPCLALPFISSIRSPMIG